MVQPSIPDAMSPLAAACRPAPVPAEPAHDEVLLVAALERIEAKRLALEELLSAGLSGVLFV
jgi:hypothetical protein